MGIIVFIINLLIIQLFILNINAFRKSNKFGESIIEELIVIPSDESSVPKNRRRYIPPFIQIALKKQFYPFGLIDNNLSYHARIHIPVEDKGKSISGDEKLPSFYSKNYMPGSKIPIVENWNDENKPIIPRTSVSLPDLSEISKLSILLPLAIITPILKQSMISANVTLRSDKLPSIRYSNFSFQQLGNKKDIPIPSNISNQLKKLKISAIQSEQRFAQQNKNTSGPLADVLDNISYILQTFIGPVETPPILPNRPSMVYPPSANLEKLTSENMINQGSKSKKILDIEDSKELLNDTLLRLIELRLRKFWYIGQCRRDYFSIICPINWLLKDNICYPPEDNDICDAINLMNASIKEKEEFSWKCKAEYPCLSANIVNYEKLCPEGWMNIGSKVCIAPLSYSGICSPAMNFENFTLYMKIAWSAKCEANWETIYIPYNDTNKLYKKGPINKHGQIISS